MEKQPSAGTGAPVAHSTNKDYYTPRQDVSPTTTPGLSFKNPNEGSMHTSPPCPHVAYTDINGRAPTAEERGAPSAQAKMGAGGVDMRHGSANFTHRYSLKDVK